MINLTSEFINAHDEKELFLILKIMLRIRENLTCWPSIETIAKDTGWSENTVRKYSRILEDKGSLDVVDRFYDSGKQTSKEYRVTAEGVGVYIPAKKLASGGSNSEGLGVQNLKGSPSKVEGLGVQNLNPNSLDNINSLNKGKNQFSPPSKNDVYLDFKCRMDDAKIAGSRHWAIWETNKFFDFYENKKWKVGRVKMRNWKLAVSNWFTSGREKGRYRFLCPDDPQYNATGNNQPPVVATYDKSVVDIVKNQNSLPITIKKP